MPQVSCSGAADSQGGWAARGWGGWAAGGRGDWAADSWGGCVHAHVGSG